MMFIEDAYADIAFSEEELKNMKPLHPVESNNVLPPEKEIHPSVKPIKAVDSRPQQVDSVQKKISEYAVALIFVLIGIVFLLRHRLKKQKVVKEKKIIPKSKVK